MISLQREKEPSETIRFARECLSKINLQVYEVHWCWTDSHLYSVMLSAIFGDDNLVSHGKGQTPDEALAGAYGEFLERLQNNNFFRLPTPFYQLLQKEFGFSLFPDEIDNRIIPFVNLTKNNVITIPYDDFLNKVGSNGMAAGNSKNEAIYQGICEILERYSIRQLFKNSISITEVAQSVLINFPEILKLTTNIQKKHFLQVKTFNLSEETSFPVVGVLITDKNNTKYRMRIACHVDFEVAVLRCIQELFQDSPNISSFINTMIPIPLQCNSAYNWESEFKKFSADGTGILPFSFFERKIPVSNNLKYFNQNKDLTKILCDTNLIKVLQNNGYNIFVHDTSYLGFPSCHVFIPKLSEMSTTEDRQSKLDLLSLVQNIQEYRYEQIADMLVNVNSTKSLYKLCNISLKPEETLNYITLDFFMFLLAARDSYAAKALHHLKQFYNSSQLFQNNYYQNIIVQLEKVMSNKSSIRNIALFKNPDSIMKAIPIPTCPICTTCPLSDICYVTADDKLPVIAGEKFPLLGI